MDKSGKMKKATLAYAVVGVLVVYIFFGAQLGTFFGGLKMPGASITSGTVPTGQQYFATCPTDGDTSLVLTVQNVLNTTAQQTYDVAGTLVSSGGNQQTVADTSAGTYTVNCGETYTLKLLRSDGANGDSGFIRSIIQGIDAVVNPDGSVSFTPKKSNYNLVVGSAQHGVLEFRSYDNKAAGWSCHATATCSEYEADGASFVSTSNGTQEVVGAGGEVDRTIQARATAANNDFNDAYWLILVEAPTATWDIPVVSVNGQVLSDAKGTLTVHESRQFSGYEYIYKVVGVPVTDDGVDVRIKMDALAGVDPSTDPEVDFAAAGNYLSVDGVNVLTGAADDTASSAVVYTVMDTVINIS